MRNCSNVSPDLADDSVISPDLSTSSGLSAASDIVKRPFERSVNRNGGRGPLSSFWGGGGAGQAAAIRRGGSGGRARPTGAAMDISKLPRLSKTDTPTYSPEPGGADAPQTSPPPGGFEPVMTTSAAAVGYCACGAPLRAGRGFATVAAPGRRRGGGPGAT